MSNSDNFTAHTSVSYDGQIKNTIPYYEQFHREIINFVKVIKKEPKLWLDTGCGTGSLVEEALNHFKSTNFILADPSEGMLFQAEKKFNDKNDNRVTILKPAGTQEIILDKDLKPEVITAIQAHHYLSVEERKKATMRCYELLENNGVYITFENISPLTELGVEIGKEYWNQFQVKSGKSFEEAEKHRSRFGTEYFPITITEHLEILKSCGFKAVEMFWYSYMQAGFYCIK